MKKEEINQKAIKYAERVCNGEFPITYTREKLVNHTDNDFAEGYKAALEQSGWVSVEDRLPTIEDTDEYGSVLALYKDGNKHVHGYKVIGGYSGITHWAKILPLPPKPNS